jgi:hypothetical protein
MGDEPTPYEDLGPTRRLTSTGPLSPPRQKSAKTARLIAELGLRYRPAASTDLEAHAATLALLTRDLAGEDPLALERAIAKWVRSSPFMPKAADLLELIRQDRILQGPGVRLLRLQRHAQNANAELEAKGRYDIRWVIRNGELVLDGV